MEILWVKVGGLWPPNTGGRLRSIHILSELSRAHRVTLLTTHAPNDNGDALNDLLPQCERIVSFPHAAPKYRSPGFPFVLLRSWVSALPVDLYKYRVPALRKEAVRLLESGEFDLCVADFLSAVPNVPLRGPVPVIFFAHNVEHMIWKRLCDNDDSPWRRALLEIELRKMRRYESLASRYADLTIAVSPEDRDLLSANAPGSDACTVPTGVDVSYFSPNGIKESPAELVFTGSMDWHPNEDAILYFIERILPAVRHEVPRASLTVVGRNPSRRLRHAAKAAAVQVTGTVDDIRPYVAEATVYVVPLRIGGGTRLKIFEALAMGKAVVSTTVGAEGLPLDDERHFLRADDPAEFSRAVVALLKDPERRKRLGAAGRRLVAERYSWSHVGREFEASCRRVLS